MKSRVEGQIWIDRNSPNRLKYYVNGEEYEVNVAQNYKGQDGIVKGSVVKLEHANNSDVLCKAGFPDDLEKVIGIAGQTYVEGDREVLPILQTDSLIFDQSEVSSAFVDLDEAIADWGSDSSKGIGAPIYWFIGRTKKSGSTYNYTDSFNSNYKGKLTFNTPSGYQWKVSSFDEGFNVGYDNLPLVGRVASYKIENGVFTYLKMNANYFGFERQLGWSWPYVGNGLKSPTDRKVSIDIRHGLFADSISDTHDIKIRPRCLCDIIALEQNNDTEYKTACIVDNFYGITEEEEADSDKRTHIEMHTSDTYRYNIHGNVVYKFDKE